jgi:hypothetical protein
MNWFKELYCRKDSPGYLMQLFSTLASLFFAGFAIYLTIKMDKTDTKTEKLTNIVMKLDTTNQNLIFTQRQNDTIIRELFKQSLVQNSQLKSLVKQYNVTKDKALFENQKDWLEYEKLIAEFREFVYVELIFKKSEFLNLSKSEKIQILKVLSEITEKILLNPVVYSDSKYFSEWKMFNDFWFKTFNFSMINYSIQDKINITYEGKLITSGEEYLNKVFEDFQLNFKELENKMSTSTIDWQKKYLNIK